MSCSSHVFTKKQLLRMNSSPIKSAMKFVIIWNSGSFFCESMWWALNTSIDFWKKKENQFSCHFCYFLNFSREKRLRINRWRKPLASKILTWEIIWNSYGILSDFFKNSIVIALYGHKYVTIALKYVLNVST